MPYVDANSATIYYSDDGSGPGVLLVHGGLFDPMDGERFWHHPGVVDDLVAAGYRALVPDRRYGTGRSTANFGPHSWEVEAADLSAVVRASGPGKVHLVTGSNGCSAALTLALNSPELICSLLLCWPAVPENARLNEAFRLSADWIEKHGTEGYLTLLHERGFPVLGEARAGFPFGVALLNDERSQTSFRRLPAIAAAGIVRETAARMLPGNVLRGIDRDAARRAGHLGVPIGIVPADPEGQFHPRSTADVLAGALGNAAMLDGCPVTPSPLFASRRPAFAATLRHWLEAAL